MKNRRQSAIRSIIQEHDVETQGELANYLNQNGFQVTQATVSRDIKEMRLVKVSTDHGRYKYAFSDKGDARSSGVPLRVFADTVVNLELAGNLLVVHTLAGSASAAAEALESQHWPEIIGTIAGDNTIFIAVKDSITGNELLKKLRRLVK